MTIFKNSLIFLLFSFCSAYNDIFNEELLLNPLPNGHIYTYFQFTTKWEANLKDAQHSHLFPRALAEILNQYHVREFHISMTQGLWRHEYWGYPVIDAPPGAEVWAWFENDVGNVDLNWKRLMDTLSGLFCASLNFIDGTNSVIPEFSFRPEGVVPDKHFNKSNVRYASLPREVVCTENLTPWKKMLPCEAKRGFASLLNAAQIHNTRYHSLGLHIRPVCSNKQCTSSSLEIRQTVSLVYDPALMPTKRDWSFRYLFGQGLLNTCVLANSSIVYVDITHNFTNTFKVTPEPTKIEESSRGGFKRTYAVYDLTGNTDQVFSISSKLKGEPKIIPNSPPPLYANRYLVGYGQEKGGIATRIHNNHWKELNIIYFEQIPWYIEIYLHTLQIESNGKIIQPSIIRYIPGQTRERPYYIEIGMTLPARSITTISVKFNYVFLKWQEYPPDANHGFYIGSAVITSALPLAKNYTGIPIDGSLIADSFNASRQTYPIRFYTEILLVSLPTPDFSMPYNVVCLACTVIALAFGPLHNITTKRLQRKKIEDVRKNIISTCLEKLKNFISRIEQP
ncbi:GPI transamidase component PIG-T [Chrysoperla carnea]|uniref:GPI transamidase component PIG-T n=1 Tax=Chrysoperla carnea TaxID=189513 RepID=UPI001D0681FC|nr:GPI transamidase component PIG-T [Chrysoperla carnea]